MNDRAEIDAIKRQITDRQAETRATSEASRRLELEKIARAELEAERVKPAADYIDRTFRRIEESYQRYSDYYWEKHRQKVTSPYKKIDDFTLESIYDRNQKPQPGHRILKAVASIDHNNNVIIHVTDKIYKQIGVSGPPDWNSSGGGESTPYYEWVTYLSGPFTPAQVDKWLDQNLLKVPEPMTPEQKKYQEENLAALTAEVNRQNRIIFRGLAGGAAVITAIFAIATCSDSKGQEIQNPQNDNAPALSVPAPQ